MAYTFPCIFYFGLLHLKIITFDYERVNLAGKRLSALDVSEAVYISKYPELFSKIKEKSIFYKSQGFGSDKSFSRKRILNNISVELYRSIASRPKELSVFKPKTREGKAHYYQFN